MGPALMLHRLVHVRREDVPAVTVRPFRPAIQALGDLNRNNRNFIAINTVVAPSQCLRQEAACCNIAAACPCPWKK